MTLAPMLLLALAATANETPRTLDEISIEGEVAMPQVWFVTARELPRYHDGVEWLLEPRAATLEQLLATPSVVWPLSSWALPDSLAFTAEPIVQQPGHTSPR